MYFIIMSLRSKSSAFPSISCKEDKQHLSEPCSALQPPSIPAAQGNTNQWTSEECLLALAAAGTSGQAGFCSHGSFMFAFVKRELLLKQPSKLYCWQVPAQTLPVSQVVPTTLTAETAQLAQRIVQQQRRWLVRSLRTLVWASCPQPCLWHKGHGQDTTWWWHTCWTHAVGQRTHRSCAELVVRTP